MTPDEHLREAKRWLRCATEHADLQPTRVDVATQAALATAHAAVGRLALSIQRHGAPPPPPGTSIQETRAEALLTDPGLDRLVRLVTDRSIPPREAAERLAELLDRHIGGAS